MATAEATEVETTEAPQDEATFGIKRDAEVGSFLLSAPFEAWQTGVKAMRDADGDVAKMADSVTKLLRAANSNPSPGQVISIEIMPSTEADAIVDTLTGNMGLPVEEGEYSRKSRTSKSPAANKSAAAAKTGGAKKSKGTPRECTCGCGGMTAGGLFLPGHDARYKGRLLARIREGGADGEEALELLAQHPNLYNIDKARGELGTAAAKKEAQAQRLKDLKAKKAAEADASDESDADADEETTEEASE